MIDYKTRIYKDYASNWQDTKIVFDKNSAERWGKAYQYYLCGWLPKNKDAVIIDLGCGGGRLLHFLKLQGYNCVCGIDFSPDQVRLAKQVAHNVEECEVLDFLGGHANSYDLIVALDVVEHFKKDEALRFLDGCFNALKKDGRLILQTVNAESPWGLTQFYGDFTHEMCLNPNSLKRLLNLCGFRSIEIKELGPIPFGYTFVSTCRFFIWQVFRLFCLIWNYVEIGEKGSGIFTRNFIISAIRQ